MEVVIMAGGKGLQFWPRSVESKPKQFLALTSHESMLQQTYHRFRKYVDISDIYVVAGSSYISLIREQLPLLDPSRLIVEPSQRDTRPFASVQQFGLVPFEFKVQNEIVDIFFDEPYADVNYVLTAITSHPSCYAVTNSAQLSVVRARFSSDVYGIINWISVGSRA